MIQTKSNQFPGQCRPLFHRLLVGAVVCFAIPFLVLWTSWLFGYRVNLSPSLAKGVYRAIDGAPERGTLVEFCPPQTAGYLALRRGYRDSGLCADYGQPLLKPIAALPGDWVFLGPNGLRVANDEFALGFLTPIYNTAPLEKDSQGRPLEHYPFGYYRVKSGEIWVVSSWNAKSFDSRYFGPIPVTAIRHYEREVWTWGKPN